MRDAGSLDHYLMSERIGKRTDRSPFFYAYLKFIHLVEQWKIQKTLLLSFRHIGDYRTFMAVIWRRVHVWSSNSGKHPLAVLHYIQVQTFLPYGSHVGT